MASSKEKCSHGVPKNQGEIWRRRGEKLFKGMSEYFHDRLHGREGGRNPDPLTTLNGIREGNGCAFLTDCLPTRESHQKMSFAIFYDFISELRVSFAKSQFLR